MWEEGLLNNFRIATFTLFISSSAFLGMLFKAVINATMLRWVLVVRKKSEIQGDLLRMKFMYGGCIWKSGISSALMVEISSVILFFLITWKK